MSEGEKESVEQRQQAEEEDDLSSFGSLHPPDQEAGGQAPSQEEPEADLAALAASIAAGGGNDLYRVDQVEPESDSTIDLRGAAEAGSDAAAGSSDTDRSLPGPAARLPTAAARTGPVVPLVLASFALGLGAGAAIFLAKDWMETDAGNGAAPPAAPARQKATGPEASEIASTGVVHPASLSAGEAREAAPEEQGIGPASGPQAATGPAAGTPEAALTPAVAATAPADRRPLTSTRAPGRAGDSRAEASATPAAASAAPPEPRAAGEERPVANPGTDSAGVIDELLGEALGEQTAGGGIRAPGGRKTAAEPGDDMMGGDQLPLTPSRQQLADAMKVLLPAIRGCAMGRTGLATASIVIRNNGRVASVTVQGEGFANSPSGRCIEGAIRKARFPEFRQSVFRVTYPLSIQGAARDQEIPR